MKREIAGAAVWYALTGGVHLRKVSVSGGLTVCLNRFSKMENFITMDQAAVCHWFKLSGEWGYHHNISQGKIP